MHGYGTDYSQQLLATELKRRRANNSRYSQRSFARDLGVDVAALSRVLSGKGNLTLALGRKISAALNLSVEERELFLESIADKRKLRSLQVARDLPKGQEQAMLHLEQDQFAIISNLYHYAILEFVQTDGFEASYRQMAQALGITTVEAQEAVARLLRLGLLKKDGGKLYKADAFLTTKNKTQTSRALRHHQRQILQNALFRLENEPIEKRILSGMTIPIDTAKIPLARELIDEFSKKMADIMSAGKRNAVYQLHVSFCSLMAPQKNL